MAELNSILSHSSSVVSRKTGKEYILVPVTDNIADMDSVYTLNETGAFIWELIDGIKTVEEITEMLGDEFDIDKKTATADVLAFIEKMQEYLVIR